MRAVAARVGGVGDARELDVGGELLVGDERRGRGNSEATAAGARVARRLSEPPTARTPAPVSSRASSGASAAAPSRGGVSTVRGARTPSRERARRVGRVEARRRAPGPAPRGAGAPPTRATTVGVLVPDERIARAAEGDPRARALGRARTPHRCNIERALILSARAVRADESVEGAAVVSRTVDARNNAVSATPRGGREKGTIYSRVKEMLGIANRRRRLRSIDRTSDISTRRRRLIFFRLILRPSASILRMNGSCSC